MGFYKEVGLDVTILESLASSNIVRDVVSGKVQYATGSSSLVLDRIAGKPVVVLAAIHQHSPYVFLTADKNGDGSIHDIVNKRVMIEPHAAELLAYLLREGISTQDINILPYSANPDDLIENKTDFYEAYSTNEPYTLQQKGFTYQVFSPRSVGIDFYGDNLFTSEDELKYHPKRVAAFREASLRGWRYAEEHPNEMINLIINKYNHHQTIERLQFEAKAQDKLIQSKMVEIGYMHPDRWNHIAKVYQEIGILKETPNLNGFIYDISRTLENRSKFYKMLIITMLIIGILTAIVIYILSINKRLRHSFLTLEKTKTSLAESEENFKQLANNTSASIFILKDTTLISINVAGQSLTGYASTELLNKNIFNLVHLADHQLIVNKMNELHQNSTAKINEEIRLIHKNGNIIWVEITANKSTYQQEPVIIGTVYDITRRKIAETNLRNSQNLHQTLTETMKDVVWIVDLESEQYTYISPSVISLSGFTTEEIITQPLIMTMTTESYKSLLQEIERNLKGFLNHEFSSEKHFTYEIEQNCKNGQTVWVEIILHFQRNIETNKVEVVGSTRDISERKKSDNYIRHLAMHDSLTGLPNRILFTSTVEKEISRSTRTGLTFALLFIDLDHFKPVNDQFGHAVGDMVLIETAGRMKHCLRQYDTVGRIGGDEFVVIIPNIDHASVAINVAKKILLELQSPFYIKSESINISASIGISIYPNHGATFTELSKNADHAMYQAKNGGRNNAVLAN
ncbi:MAG: diguanylate cyclase [Zetaproteobacteria bacterium]|nr:diguanylate cyclase [Zetaproteobacteria bacterium]